MPLISGLPRLDRRPPAGFHQQLICGVPSPVWRLCSGHTLGRIQLLDPRLYLLSVWVAFRRLVHLHAESVGDAGVVGRLHGCLWTGVAGSGYRASDWAAFVW